MSSIEDKLIQLVELLAEQTDKGVLKWKRTDSEATFLLTRRQGSATIKSVDGDGRSPYEFALLNGNGEEVETLTEDRTENGPMDRPLRALYEAARASALDITPLLNAWLADVTEEPF